MTSIPTLNRPPQIQFLKRLVTPQGILQHSRFSQPSQVTGYSLDDNARGLLVSAWLANLYPQEKEFLQSLCQTCLDFITGQQDQNNHLRNYLFISFQERFLSREWAEDSLGQTIWALGFLLSSVSWFPNQAQARKLFLKQYSQLAHQQSLRTLAYGLRGLLLYLQKEADPKIYKLAFDLASKLAWAFKNNQEKNWCWYEDKLTYANAILPWAFLHAGFYFKKKSWFKSAEKSLLWLMSISLEKKVPVPVGQRGWYFKGGSKSRFDQQPIEAGYMVLACCSAYCLTANKLYLQEAQKWFTWFWGKNLAGLCLIDKTDGGCYDGLEPWQVNLNKGAESTICYLLAVASLKSAQGKKAHER
ncbi:hypothetical protein ACFLZP_01825 [Patescibacteria group bacterium]